MTIWSAKLATPAVQHVMTDAGHGYALCHDNRRAASTPGNALDIARKRLEHATKHNLSFPLPFSPSRIVPHGSGSAAERKTPRIRRRSRPFSRATEADLNKDGVFDLEEAQQARRQLAAARAKQQATRPAPRVEPTEADVPYGEHARHVLDFWRAQSDKPTPLFIWIHGGGFRAGDKKSFPGDLLKQCLDAGISCASIHYRLSDSAPYPAQMLDSARAIQFLRRRPPSGTWIPASLRPARSAGSGISQWLAYTTIWPIRKRRIRSRGQATRLRRVPLNMQSTYDREDQAYHPREPTNTRPLSSSLVP